MPAYVNTGSSVDKINNKKFENNPTRSASAVINRSCDTNIIKLITKNKEINFMLFLMNFIAK